MKKLYYAYKHRLISVYSPLDDGRTYKELDICGSLYGEYRVGRYSLTTPNIKSNICYIK